MRARASASASAKGRVYAAGKDSGGSKEDGGVGKDGGGGNESGGDRGGGRERDKGGQTEITGDFVFGRSNENGSEKDGKGGQGQNQTRRGNAGISYRDSLLSPGVAGFLVRHDEEEDIVKGGRLTFERRTRRKMKRSTRKDLMMRKGMRIGVGDVHPSCRSRMRNTRIGVEHG